MAGETQRTGDDRAEGPVTVSPTRPMLSLLGPPKLSFGGRDVPVANRKALALLAYLACTAHGSESRERLAGLLWSESSEEKARASLRQTVGDLKDALRVCEVSPFAVDRLNVHLRLPLARTDLGELRASMASNGLDPLLLERKRLADSLLAGFEELDPAFRTWLVVQRQCLHDELTRRLEDRVAEAPDWALRKRLGLALLNLDPTHEFGCRTAMEASTRLGDTAGALRIYRSLWNVLEEEFDCEPSEATQLLVSAIKLGRIAASPQASEAGDGSPLPPAGHAAEPGRERSGPGLFLLVDGFEASALPADAEVSVRALRHELIASLVRFRDWAVLDLDGQPPVGIARLAFLIGATAFDADGDLRLVVTLKDLGSSRFVWSEQCLIRDGDWSRARQGIIRRIAAALDLSASSERLAQIADAPDLSLDGFDRWLKGQELMLRWRPDDEAKAEQLLRSIIARNPRFAPAHAGVAGILNSRHLIYPGTLRSPARHGEALGFAKTAVELDPLDMRTQLNLAWSYAMNGLPRKASVNFLLACDLNPYDPWTLVSAALGLAYCGDLREAEELSRLAVDTGLGTARLHWSYHAGVRFILGDLAGCVEAAERAGNGVFYLGGWKAAAHALAGDRQEARREFEVFVRLIRENWSGPPQPDESDVSRWLLHCFPIADASVLARLEDGLRLAATAPPRPVRLAPRPSAAAADRVVGDA